MTTRRLFTSVFGLVGWLTLGLSKGVCMADVLCPDEPNCKILTRMEADYIVACQYSKDAKYPAYGAINNVCGDPTKGVWHVAIDGNGNPQLEPYLGDLPSWIQYAPQMLDLPVFGVNSIDVGQWIQDTFQQADGSCIDYEWEKGQLKTRKYPGYSFQATLCWFDTGQADYADAAVPWCRQSGLWKTSPGPGKDDPAGGWIDWVEVEPNPGGRPESWKRFIDTSFYAIAAFHGGYDFRVH